MNKDVVALGELLIDFTENGISSSGNPLFEANPGGAPCNVLSMLNNLGKKTAFIGKAGDDAFGRMLKKTLDDLGIDTAGLLMDKEVHTTLAFVHNSEDGDRDFSFYRKPGADMMLRSYEVKYELIDNARLFHFGTLSMTNKEVREATLSSLAYAKEKGCLISFDPNLRVPLWDDLEDAKEAMKEGLMYCDILKISDNEIEFLTGESDYTEGVKKIRKDYPVPLILVSMGRNGSRAYLNGEDFVEVESFIMEDTQDTTGAGDTFCACCINFVLDNGLDLTQGELRNMLIYANAAAAIVTTRKGALKVMPKDREVRSLMDGR